jgi:ADP-ribose pyrophosphatase YjhB (NUDIX family)
MERERFKLAAVTHLVLINNEEVLLLRRQNTGFADGMYSVPGGCLEEGETLREAMIREAREEIGIILKPQWLSSPSIIHRSAHKSSNKFAFFFKVLNFEGDIYNAEPEKCSELKFFPLKALPYNLIPHVERGVCNILNDVVYDEFD